MGMVLAQPGGWMMTTPVDPAEQNARTWNMLCHLSALAEFILPFGNILGPLIVWQLKKNEIPSVDVHGKESLNFQITVTLLAFLICIPLMLLMIGFELAPLIGIASLVVLVIAGIKAASLVLLVIAGIKANNGEAFAYPFSLKLVK
jgi:uncharacterized Tic20 family protein